MYDSLDRKSRSSIRPPPLFPVTVATFPISSNDIRMSQTSYSPSTGHSGQVNEVIESSTRKSLCQGILLILTLMTCLATFIFSMTGDNCIDYPHHSSECPSWESLMSAGTSILTFLFVFTVYFLHLFGVCDYSSSILVRTKVAWELFLTIAILSLSFSSSLLYLLVSSIHHELPCQGVVISSLMTVKLLIVRIVLLLREVGSSRRRQRIITIDRRRCRTWVSSSEEVRNDNGGHGSSICSTFRPIASVIREESQTV